MRRLLALLILSVLAHPALAAPGPRQAYSKYGTVLSAQGLDASRSFTIDLSEPVRQGVFGLMLVWVSLTDADDSTTDFDMTCTGSHDGGTTDYTLQSCAVATGACTSSNASWSKDPSGITSPKRWVWRVDAEGVPEVECTFTDTGGDASDTITVDVTFATKGS